MNHPNNSNELIKDNHGVKYLDSHLLDLWEDELYNDSFNKNVDLSVNGSLFMEKDRYFHEPMARGTGTSVLEGIKEEDPIDPNFDCMKFLAVNDEKPSSKAEEPPPLVTSVDSNRRSSMMSNTLFESEFMDVVRQQEALRISDDFELFEDRSLVGSLHNRVDSPPPNPKPKPQPEEPAETYSFKIVNSLNGANVVPKENSMMFDPDPLIFKTVPSQTPFRTRKGPEPTVNPPEINIPELLGLTPILSGLFHAFLCLNTKCTYHNCSMYKREVRHVAFCQLNPCQTRDCYKLRTIIQHYALCGKSQCRGCASVEDILKSVYDLATHTAGGIPQQVMDSDIARTIFGSLLRSFTSPVSASADRELTKLKLAAQSSQKLPQEQLTSIVSSQTTKPTTDFQGSSVAPDPMNDFQGTIHEGDAVLKSSFDQNFSADNALQDISPQNLTEKEYDPKDIFGMFHPVVAKMLKMAEAHYFKEPVDPVKLGIPDYPEIVKEPMDLGTILSNLKSHKYVSPWSVVYDVNLVFDNAYLYNKRNTRVHKSAVKLASIFEPVSDQIMRQNGYCCNKRYVYSPQVLYCNSRDFCVIAYNTHYYRCDDKTFFCTNCFNNTKGDYMSVIKEGAAVPISIPKTSFKYTRNNEPTYEPFVVCCSCRRKFHKVCTMHVDVIDGKYFYCKWCSKKLDMVKLSNKFVSRNLPRTKLSDYIERSVNEHVRSEFKDCKYISFRVICNVDKVIETKRGLVAKYGSNISTSFPYRSKAIFAFQEHEENQEVCFFSMHVQEYGAQCPEPNRRRVYLSYLDSVHYFRPKHLKTFLYHEIILSYLAYCKSMGFLWCHIWSCPPCEGDDYVFHCHPYEQKLPKPRRLLEWYNKMIELGIRKKIIIELKDIYKYFENYIGELATAIPYFEGDYWSNSLEDIVTEYEKELLNGSDVISKNKGAVTNKKNKLNKNKVSKQKNSTPKKSSAEVGTLNQKLFSLMEKYREVFFILKINDENVQFIKDPDPIFTSDLMDGRSGFLTMSRDNNWEFSSFRHALHSTKAMMFVVHQQMFNFVEFTCDKCRCVLVEGYHCMTCKTDFDHCFVCHNRYTHEHQMVKKIYINFSLSAADILTGKSLHAITSKDKPQGAKFSNYEHFQTVVCVMLHCFGCIKPECSSYQCTYIKKILNHFEHCNILNRYQTCRICRTMFHICNHHATRCAKSICRIPLCSRIRSMKCKRQAATEMRTRRRIANMDHEFSQPVISEIKNSTNSVQKDPCFKTSPDGRRSSAVEPSHGPLKASGAVLSVNDPIFSSIQPTADNVITSSSRGRGNHGVSVTPSERSASNVRVSLNNATRSQRSQTPDLSRISTNDVTMLRTMLQPSMQGQRGDQYRSDLAADPRLVNPMAVNNLIRANAMGMVQMANNRAGSSHYNSVPEKNTNNVNDAVGMYRVQQQLINSAIAANQVQQMNMFVPGHSTNAASLLRVNASNQNLNSINMALLNQAIPASVQLNNTFRRQVCQANEMGHTNAIQTPTPVERMSNTSAQFGVNSSQESFGFQPNFSIQSGPIGTMQMPTNITTQVDQNALNAFLNSGQFLVNNEHQAAISMNQINLNNVTPQQQAFLLQNLRLPYVYQHNMSHNTNDANTALTYIQANQVNPNSNQVSQQQLNYIVTGGTAFNSSDQNRFQPMNPSDLQRQPRLNQPR